MNINMILTHTRPDQVSRDEPFDDDISDGSHMIDVAIQ